MGQEQHYPSSTTALFFLLAPKWVRVALWSIALALLPETVAAQSESSARMAGRLFAAGQDAVDAGEYTAAIRVFEQSYQAKPHPNTLFAMAQALRKQYMLDRIASNAHRAIELYRQFTKEQPRSPWRATADSHVLDLLAALSREPTVTETETPPALPSTQLMVVSRTPGARIFVDGEDLGEASPSIRVVDPGNHEVRVEARGFVTERRTARVLEGRLVVAEVELEPVPGTIKVISSEDDATVFVDGIAVGATPYEESGFVPGDHTIAVTSNGFDPWTATVNVEPERTALGMADLKWSGQRKAAVITIGTSGVLLLAGLTTGFFAVQADSSLWNMATSNNDERRDYNDKLETRDALSLSSTILLGTAVAALATGLLLYWFDKPDTSAILAKVSKSTHGFDGKTDHEVKATTSSKP